MVWCSLVSEDTLVKGFRTREGAMGGDVIVRFLQNLQHEILIGAHRLVADEPKEVGGDDAGPTPQLLVLGALGA